jgi:putative intracellular protease/amidase
MAETVHLAVYDTLADWEYGFAVAAINKPDWQKRPGRYEIRTVGLSAEPITTMGGVRITPDLALADLKPSDSAMLIMPGSDTWETGENAAFGKAARKFLDAGVPVAAICGATMGLAAEGLLNDRDHTGNAVQQLEMMPGYTGAEHYREVRAHSSDGLVTAGAAGALEFARAIFVELDLYTPEVVEAWYGLYSTGDPAWFGKLMEAAS